MFAPSISQEMLRNKVHDLILAEKEERDNERWLRHIEQSEILNFINAHINKCKEKYVCTGVTKLYRFIQSQYRDTDTDSLKDWSKCILYLQRATE